MGPDPRADQARLAEGPGGGLRPSPPVVAKPQRPARSTVSDVESPVVVDPGPLPWREVRLVDPKRRLSGVPDLVERIDGLLTVVDYKTGLRRRGLEESHSNQLLLYCALVEYVLGELPARAQIRTASGDVIDVNVDPTSVSTSVSRAQRALSLIDGASWC